MNDFFGEEWYNTRKGNEPSAKHLANACGAINRERFMANTRKGNEPSAKHLANACGAINRERFR